MKAIVIEGFGGVDKLQMKEFITPKPGDNEVQFHVIYSGVNPVDWKIREGMLQRKIPHEFPLILGWEASGVISSVGKNVKSLKMGDEIFAYCRKPIVKWGTYSEYVCFDAEHVVLKPKNINFAQAASIPLTSLTAWQALFDTAHLKKGETVLIHAGSGGVGSMAIQLAKNAGAKIITTCSSKNFDYVKQLGADFPVDYTHMRFEDAVKKVAPNGVDVVFDTLGEDTLARSYDLLKPNGRIVSLVEFPKPPADRKHIQAGYVFVRPDGSELKQIADLISVGIVIPPHIEEMHLDQAAEAQEKVRQGHTKGKIVLKIN